MLFELLEKPERKSITNVSVTRKQTMVFKEQVLFAVLHFHNRHYQTFFEKNVHKTQRIGLFESRVSIVLLTFQTLLEI